MYKIQVQIEVEDMTKNSQPFEDAIRSVWRKDFERFMQNIDKFDINECDSDKETILWRAATHGLTDWVKEILKRGANVQAADREGITPLHIAAMRHHVDVVRLLIDAGADVNAKDKFGNNVIYRATFEANGRVEVIEELLKAGADPTEKNHYGMSAVDLALGIANYDNRPVYIKHGYL